jgi:hypothetical protein
MLCAIVEGSRRRAILRWSSVAFADVRGKGAQVKQVLDEQEKYLSAEIERLAKQVPTAPVAAQSSLTSRPQPLYGAPL